MKYKEKKVKVVAMELSKPACVQKDTSAGSEENGVVWTFFRALWTGFFLKNIFWSLLTKKSSIQGRNFLRSRNVKSNSDEYHSIIFWNFKQEYNK